MNSTKRGDAFEDTIHQLIEQQIKTGRFWAGEECCAVFKKKGYYSEARKKHITFDVSIEITLPGHNEYSILVPVVCKDYTNSVPVDDVEEFWAKVRQVSGANVKGVLATTTALQEGGLNFAKSMGFGVLRYFGSNDFKWVLTRSPSWSANGTNIQSPESKRALTDESFSSAHYDCYFYVRGVYTNSSNRMFELLCLGDATDLTPTEISLISNPGKENRLTVPYLSKDHIEGASRACLGHIDYASGAVDLEQVCTWQHETRGLTVDFKPRSERGDAILGALSFAPLAICIYTAQSNRGRQRFTLAHELGHIFLGHDQHLLREVTEEGDLDYDSRSDLQIDDVRRMEWQANFFASSLLLPARPFGRQFFAIAHERGLHDKGFGILYVDSQPVNVQNYLAVTNHLMQTFDVSRHAVVIRLKELGFLNDVRQDTGLRPLTR